MKVQGLTFVLFVCIGSIFALTGLRQFFVDPLAGTGSNVVWFLIQVAPLLALLPGVLRLSVRSAFFAILVSLLYFIHGVVYAAAAEIAWFGVFEVLFSLAMCTAATLLLRVLREQQAETE